MIKHDLHCHILPGIDDGAKTVDDSLALLHMEKDQGIRHIAFTPHFYCKQESMTSFLDRRQHAFELLQQHSPSTHYRLGAEVLLTSKLMSLELDMSKLTLQDTDYILIELPFNYYPTYMHDSIYEVIQQGFTPILAHIERYGYFREQPILLQKLVAQGCLAHVTADSILSSRDKGFCKACLNHDLAHFIASDTHSVDKRPPQMEAAFSKLDSFLQEKVTDNALSIWENKGIFSDPTSYPKKGLFHYK